MKKENIPLIDREIQSKLIAPKIASLDRSRNLEKNGSPKIPHLCRNSPAGMKCHEESLLFFALCFCYLFFLGLCFTFYIFSLMFLFLIFIFYMDICIYFTFFYKKIYICYFKDKEKDKEYD